MILQALHSLAHRDNLMDDPDFESKPVSWLIRIGENGDFLGITSTHAIPENTTRPVPKSFLIPRQAGRSGIKAPPHFFVDNAFYVFGKGTIDKPVDKKKATEKSGWFRETVEACAKETEDEGAIAVCAFLENLATGKEEVLLPEEAVSNDQFAFIFAPDRDRLVTDREHVRNYWKRLRKASAIKPHTTYRCLVSGVSFQEKVGNFPLLQRVPGGTPSGAALVSFNKRTFESYGWKNNENAPISQIAAETCARALSRLLHPAYSDPNQPGQTLPKRNIKISADTVVCYWSEETQTDGFTSVFAALLEANPEEVGELYRSVWRGQTSEIENSSPFYALTLSGAQGRVIVRDWFESTIKNVEHNLSAYFSDLDIVRNTPKPRDGNLPPHMPLNALLESLAPLGKQAEIPAHLASQFIRTALSGTPFPFAALLRAIGRIRAEIGKEQDQKLGWKVKQWNDARASIIKAVLNRRRKFAQTSTSYQEIKRDMDPNNTAPGYLLGRLMAVIERMQQLALHDLNASVVDRYFSGASASPAAVFPRLLKNLRHHARKAKDEPQTGGTTRWLENQVDEITVHLSSFPSHLNLEQQGLFVLGYHHQRNWLWTKKEDREAV